MTKYEMKLEFDKLLDSTIETFDKMEVILLKDNNEVVKSKFIGSKK